MVRRVTAIGLLVGLLLVPVLLPTAAARREHRILEQPFHGEIHTGAGAAGHAAGLDPRAHGTLDVPDEATTAVVTLEWVSNPENRSLVLWVCEGACWEPSHRTLLATGNGTSPLQLAVPVPETDTLGWEARLDDDAAADVRLRGQAHMYAHPDHGPEGPGALSMLPATPAEGLPLWGSALAVLVAVGSAIASAAKPTTPGVLVSLYHRVDRDALLDHPNRQRLIEAVRAEPGIHLEALANELELGRGTLQHHARLLERGGLLDVEKLAGHRCYFLPGRLLGAERRALAALKSDAARTVAGHVREEGPVSLTDIADALDRSLPTVHHHVDRLLDAGVLEARRTGRTRPVTLSRLGQRALDGFPQRTSQP